MVAGVAVRRVRLQHHLDGAGEILTAQGNSNLPFLHTGFLHVEPLRKNHNGRISSWRGVGLWTTVLELDAGRNKSSIQLPIAFFPARMHRKYRWNGTIRALRVQQMVQRGHEVGMV